MFIAVIGGSECSPEVSQIAEAVGRELARRGATVVSGGLGGVMEAACRGARAEGGHTIGILPGSRREEANPYVEFAIPTGLSYARNAIVVKAAQAVIAIDGSFGTLSEIGHALAEGIPVVGLNTWYVSQEEQNCDSIIIAESPLDAVEKALAAAQEAEKTKRGQVQ
ncbi:MAG: TIGR00725 family protein [Chloroflexi bacterium]|nr:TIGR00725 family protein [Chloroflexota bacterium]